MVLLGLLDKQLLLRLLFGVVDEESYDRVADQLFRGEYLIEVPL